MYARLTPACLVLIVILGQAKWNVAMAQVAFRRGDANADSRIDLSDAIAALSYLFLGHSPLPCEDAADANDDGVINITDPIVVLQFLFVGDALIPYPGPSDGCGTDLTEDSLQCIDFSPCRVAPEVHTTTGSGDIRNVRWIFAETGDSVELTYELIDGLAIAEGDIVLGREADFLDNGIAGGLSVRAGRQFRWPNGVIPFAIEEAGNVEEPGARWARPDIVRVQIQSAVAHWNQNTVIRLVERQQEADYVAFVASNEGCSSYPGRKGGRQQIRVLNRATPGGQFEGCSLGNIEHEIGHAVGLWHEQSRCDRDDWVRVLSQNIQPGLENNFEKLCAESIDVGPYDYGSLMHYGTTFFGIEVNGIPLPTLQTLRPVPPGVTVGQRNGLSPADIAGVNQIYSLPQIWIEDFAFVAGGWRVDRHIRLLADVNGDEKQDIVGFGERGVAVSLALSTGNGFAPPELWVEAFAPLAGNWQVGLHPRLLGDVNDDRRADIVGFGDDGVWVSLSTGSSFQAPEFWLADFGFVSGWRVDQHIRLLADVNGDRRQDIVGFGGPGVLVALSTGAGFTEPSFWVEEFGALAGGWRIDQHPRLLGDVNADGLPDIVGFGDDGVIVSLSTGAGFTQPALWVADFGAVAGGWHVDSHPRLLGDVNKDRRADIVGFAEDGVWVALSTGNAFAAPERWSGEFGLLAGGWLVDRHPRLLADINGDERQDVVGFADEGVWVAISTGDSFRQGRLWIDDFGFTAGGWRADKHVRLLGDVTGDRQDDLVAFGDFGVFVLRSGIPVAFE